MAKKQKKKKKLRKNKRNKNIKRNAGDKSFRYCFYMFFLFSHTFLQFVHFVKHIFLFFIISTKRIQLNSILFRAMQKVILRVLWSENWSTSRYPEPSAKLTFSYTCKGNTHTLKCIPLDVLLLTLAPTASMANACLSNFGVCSPIRMTFSGMKYSKQMWKEMGDKMNIEGDIKRYIRKKRSEI